MPTILPKGQLKARLIQIGNGVSVTQIRGFLILLTEGGLPMRRTTRLFAGCTEHDV